MKIDCKLLLRSLLPLPHDECVEDLFGVLVVVLIALDVPAPRVLGTDIAVDGALRRL